MDEVAPSIAVKESKTSIGDDFEFLGDASLLPQITNSEIEQASRRHRSFQGPKLSGLGLVDFRLQDCSSRGGRIDGKTIEN